MKHTICKIIAQTLTTLETRSNSNPKLVNAEVEGYSLKKVDDFI